MFYYYDAPAAFPAQDAGVLVAEVPPGIRSLRDLLETFGKALAFPPYFGKNLDAFWDCVRTLDNVAAKRIVAAHRDLPPLPRPDLNAYILLLRDAAAYWERSGDGHAFEPWFPRSARGRIRAILRTFPPTGNVE